MKSFAARIWRAHRTKLVSSAVLTGGLLYTFARGGLPLVPHGGDFAQVRWWVVAAYFLSIFVTAYFRAVRWRFLLRPSVDLSRKQALPIVFIASAIQVLLPFRIGEFARPYMVSARHPVTMTTALGTIVLERIIDGLLVALILAGALIWVPALDPLPATVAGFPIPVVALRGYAWTFLTIFVTAFVAIVFFYVARRVAMRIIEAVFRPISPRLGEKIAALFEHFAGGLSFLSRRRDAAGFLLETGLYWGMGIASLQFLAWGCGVTHADGSAVTFGEACAILGMLSASIAIPGPPGMLGLFQLGIYAALSMYLPESIVTSSGAAYVFLVYICQITFTVLSAALAIAVDPGAARSAGVAASGEAATAP